ncbi:YjcZ family sporulation protein [Neobacillus sp. NRS-1170]|uniref:YjcZ family sporulation protein n=1 Tax=Neobacillus sp. NRS-1170 TaxID=3233898 RepID=UPI003D2C9AA8
MPVHYKPSSYAYDVLPRDKGGGFHMSGHISSFALIVVLFILLIIVGTSFVY